MLRTRFSKTALSIFMLVCVSGFYSCGESKRNKPNPLEELYSYEQRDSIYSVLVSDSILSESQIDTIKSYIRNIPDAIWDEAQTYSQLLNNARKSEKKRNELSSYIEVTLKKKFPKEYRNGIFLDFLVHIKNISKKEIVKFDAILEFYDNYNEKIIAYNQTFHCQIAPLKTKEYWGAFDYITSDPLRGSVTNHKAVNLKNMKIADVIIKPRVSKIYFADNTIQSMYE